jgi:hypothetical protein
MDLGPEFRFFCLALRRPQTPDDLREMRRLAAVIEHWDFIVRGARRHRVGALVLGGLQTCNSPATPASVVAALRRLSVASVRRNLVQGAEIGRLCRLLAEAGVRALALKGVALSAQLYGEPVRRDARDIDLLVDPNQLAQAAAVISHAGYRRGQNSASPRQSAAYLRWIKEYEFFHEETGGLVELHHRLTDNPNLLCFEFPALWNEREEVRLGGDTLIATMSRQRLPLYLCVHGGDHGWARLHWLVDFSAALSQAQKTATLVETADAYGLGWSFLHALLLAHDWLGLPVEENLLARCRHSGKIRRREWLMRRLYSPANWCEMAPKGSWSRAMRNSLWERLYRFSLKSDWRYRASQLRREWFSPADREAVPLPDGLSWLYPLLRPWGWLIRHLSLF